LELAEGARHGGAAQDRAGDEAEAVQDGRVLDFISGTAELKDTAKEQVRQCERARFSSEFISVLLRDFRQGGPAAIAKVRKYQPAAYMKKSARC
jgi:hypothetical protein